MFALFDPSIPTAASIFSAFLTLQNAAALAAPIRIRIYGVAQATPVPPANAAACGGAPLTTAFVDWDIPAEPLADQVKTSPDISTVIQEVVNLPGFTDTSLVYLQMKDVTPAHPALATFRAFDGGIATPDLCIDWGLAREVYFKGMHRAEYRKMR